MQSGVHTVDEASAQMAGQWNVHRKEHHTMCKSCHSYPLGKSRGHLTMVYNSKPKRRSYPGRRGLYWLRHSQEADQWM
jgi:hypothetical protein